MRRKGPGGHLLRMQSQCISLPVYTVENQKNFQPQVCATKPHRGMSQARGRRQARLPSQECVKKNSKQTPHVLHICMFTMSGQVCLQ